MAVRKPFFTEPRLFVAACAATMLAGSGISAENFDIDQRGIRFNKVELTVKVGDTVRYRNRDDITHNMMIVGTDRSLQDEGLQKPGDTVF